MKIFKIKNNWFNKDNKSTFIFNNLKLIKFKLKIIIK